MTKTEREIIKKGAKMHRQYRGLTNEGKWVYGYYCEVETVCYIILDDAQLDWEGNIHRGSFFEVIPETVGQSTGLMDKNEKEIYEGDIVEYENGNAGYGRPREQEISRDVIPSIFDHYTHEDMKVWWEQGKVIGNQWENPELLEETT